MLLDNAPTLTVDGQVMALDLDAVEPLVRAVAISLFTWRRADPDDDLPAGDRFGWWGDAFANDQGDRIGSRLWLLSRAKLTPDLPGRAAEYAREALAWLTTDGVAARVDVDAQRVGLSGLSIGVRIYRHDGSVATDIRFDSAWSFVHV